MPDPHTHTHPQTLHPPTHTHTHRKNTSIVVMGLMETEERKLEISRKDGTKNITDGILSFITTYEYISILSLPPYISLSPLNLYLPLILCAYRKELYFFVFAPSKQRC